MNKKIVKDTNRIISIMPADPGIVAVYGDHDGGPDFETPVIAWGVVDKTEENFNYTTVSPLTYEYDTNTLAEAGECDNFLGVKGGTVGDNQEGIEDNRKRWLEREERRREAFAP